MLAVSHRNKRHQATWAPAAWPMLQHTPWLRIRLSGLLKQRLWNSATATGLYLIAYAAYVTLVSVLEGHKFSARVKNMSSGMRSYMLLHVTTTHFPVLSCAGHGVEVLLQEVFFVNPISLKAIAVVARPCVDVSLLQYHKLLQNITNWQTWSTWKRELNSSWDSEAQKVLNQYYIQYIYIYYAVLLLHQSGFHF